VILQGQVESQALNETPSDVPIQHTKSASNAVLSDRRVTDDAHSSAFEESVQSSERLLDCIFGLFVSMCSSLVFVIAI